MLLDLNETLDLKDEAIGLCGLASQLRLMVQIQQSPDALHE